MAGETPSQLAPPGTGLPLVEAWVLRRFGRAMLRWRFSKATALDDLEATAQRLIARTAALSREQLSQPKLIPRLQGLEDSSRYWSPSMVLEHLVITGGAMRDLVVMLSRGIQSTQLVSTAAVKPIGRDPESVVAEFTALHRGLREHISKHAGTDWESTTHAHPWFGLLTAADWLRLIAFHLRLHERQFGLIVA